MKAMERKFWFGKTWSENESLFRDSGLPLWQSDMMRDSHPVMLILHFKITLGWCIYFSELSIERWHNERQVSQHQRFNIQLLTNFPSQFDTVNRITILFLPFLSLPGFSLPFLEAMSTKSSYYHNGALTGPSSIHTAPPFPSTTLIPQSPPILWFTHALT